MLDIFKDLNDKQQEAVNQILGPLLIIAGAGSGKTRTLTCRIINMIINHNISTNNILAVTFTNKASNEMKDRIMSMLKKNERPTVGTFHSICLQILKKEIHNLGYENNFVIYDEGNSLGIIKNILKENHPFDTDYNPKSILSAIYRAKNNLIDEEKYINYIQNNFEELVSEIYPVYQKQLKLNGALDFGDLIFKTVVLFQNFPHILDKYQELFKFISVDEYQDTNFSQYTFIKLLAEKYRNICVIGDDWQSIYGWRGADMQNILNFEKDYKDAKVIKLEKNYRSSKTIIEAANYIIKNNKNRTEKTLVTDRDLEEHIDLIEAEDGLNEGLIITDIIKKSLKNKNYSDFAILYRTNSQSRLLEEAFLKAGIPYKIVGGVRFYERKEIKDIIAYLKFINNQKDSLSLIRIINTPPRKIGTSSLELLNNYAKDNDCSLWESVKNADENLNIQPYIKDRLRNFKDLILDFIEFNKSNNVVKLVNYILSSLKFKKFLLNGDKEGEERWNNVQELISVADKYKQLEPVVSLETFLEEVSLVSDLDNLDKNRQDGCILMTLHNAKGLEFSNVFMAGLEEGLLPHSQSMMNNDELEEERRLMYVGVTRAKDKLYLLYTKCRTLYGRYNQNLPSRFIGEIPIKYLGMEEQKDILKKNETESIKFQSGDKIIHPDWGKGMIVGLMGDIATIAFLDKKIGLKKLAINITPIKK